MGSCSPKKKVLLTCLFFASVLAVVFHHHLLQPEDDFDLIESYSESPPCSKAPEGIDLVGAYGRVPNSKLILSTSFRAEILFSQGMAHAFAFNQIEGYRNFESALLFDNQCSMCYWGMALVSGPNLNSGLDQEHYLRGRGAINAALKLIHNQVRNRTNSPYVRKSTELLTYQDKAYDLIHALKMRYPDSLNEWQEKGFMHFEEMVRMMILAQISSALISYVCMCVYVCIYKYVENIENFYAVAFVVCQCYAKCTREIPGGRRYCCLVR